jgi:hypothetical protein
VPTIGVNRIGPPCHITEVANAPRRPVLRADSHADRTVAMTTSFEGLPLLHTRNYDTEVYLDGQTLKVVGSIRDFKPAGVYIDGDPEPLGIHHMTVVLDVALETLRITDVDVTFTIHPHTTCPAIVDHYDKLIGLSVSRGFNRQVRELFGGPRGCTHTTALLQAMGPVVIQSLWSVRVMQKRAAGAAPFAREPGDTNQAVLGNLNTCHIWAEDGEHVAQVRAGNWHEAPVWITKRLVELGRDPNDWMSEAGR